MRHPNALRWSDLPPAKYLKAWTLMTTPITNGLDDAEKQIRDTKALFKIDSADGLVVILNDKVEIGGQSLIKERIGDYLAKKDPDESPHHKNVNRVFHLGEMYTPEHENVYLDHS